MREKLLAIADRLDNRAEELFPAAWRDSPYMPTQRECQAATLREMAQAIRDELEETRDAGTPSHR